MSSCGEHTDTVDSISSHPQASNSVGIQMGDPSLNENLAANTQDEDDANPDNNDDDDDDNDDNTFKIKKRGRTSKCWDDMTVNLVDGKASGAYCNHCKKSFAYKSGSATTHMLRHIKSCIPRKVKLKKQNMLNFVESNTNSPSSHCIPPLHNGTFSMESMREGVAIFILLDEQPFSVLEGEGFNMMMKRGMPEWRKISRQTGKLDCLQVYGIEKNKLMASLKLVDKVCITTDLWRSKPQKIEYMVVTGHWIDSNWKLQKRVLSFVHLPPPRRGTQIADAIFKCLRDWELENKVFTVSVDNASANDSCIKIMKDTIARRKKLPCGGKLFHVRCVAHILNIIVQYGLQEIKEIIENIHDSIDYLSGSEARLQMFAEIAQQLQIPFRKLILECKTRWNTTYDMLVVALKFKEVFPRYAERDLSYGYLPSEEDWEKVEKLIPILGLIKKTTEVISGSEYPTSNLFLSYVTEIKVLLDKNAKSNDVFIRAMSLKMKERFDKYWGECNLIMAMAGVLDPRLKMMAVELSFPELYPSSEVAHNIEIVKNALYELYSEYASELDSSTSANVGNDLNINSSLSDDICDPHVKLMQRVARQRVVQPRRCDLDEYLSESTYTMGAGESVGSFDILLWWKSRQEKYRILSKMAADVLAIPITTVASEATFSAGGRIIDPYRSSLDPETVQMLICGGDWLRHVYGPKNKKVKSDDKAKEFDLPMPKVV